MKMTTNFKIWMEIDGKPVIGEGKANLLREIDRCGSLSKAASNLGISYRHAYNLIHSLNERCSQKIIETSVGGAKGGGTRLTKAGRQLVEDFTIMEMKLKEFLAGS